MHLSMYLQLYISLCLSALGPRFAICNYYYCRSSAIQSGDLNNCCFSGSVCLWACRFAYVCLCLSISLCVCFFLYLRLSLFLPLFSSTMSFGLFLFFFLAVCCFSGSLCVCVSVC